MKALMTLLVMAALPGVAGAQTGEQLALPGLFEPEVPSRSERPILEASSRPSERLVLDAWSLPLVRLLPPQTDWQVMDLEVARDFAPVDYEFRLDIANSRPGVEFTHFQFRDLEAARVLRNGGVYTLEGRALERDMERAFHDSKGTILYLNVKLRFRLFFGRDHQGRAGLVVQVLDQVHVPMEEAQARALGLAEAVKSTLTTEGVREIQILLKNTSLFSASTNLTLVDISFIDPSSSPAELADLMKRVLASFPKASLAAGAAESRRAERAVKGLEPSERARIDAKEAARAAGRK